MVDLVCQNLKWFFYQSNCLEKERQTAELKREMAKAKTLMLGKGRS